MSYIDIQHACQHSLSISDDDIIHWAKLVLQTHEKESELTIRFVDKEEITALNTMYRQQTKPTNVLAFPAEYPYELDFEYEFLGDIIVCPEVLCEEAKSFQKSLTSHSAHIIIHGILHLLGYDHIKEEDATMMQTQEIQLLARLGFENPYE